MHLNNHVLRIVNVFGVEIWITQTLQSTWIIMAVLIIFAIVVRLMLNSFKPVPTGFQNVIELMVETMDSFTVSNMGKKYAYFGNYFFGLFAFILLSNFAGLFGLRPPTADLATTAAFTLVTFVLIHFMGIFTGPKHYFKEYFQPNPIFFPIHLVGEFAKPVSLSFRMFGNILGGVIMLGMVYGMFPIFLKFVIPSVLHFYFDVFAGCIQAFIFTVLSMTFIREKIHDESEHA